MNWREEKITNETRNSVWKVETVSISESVREKVQLNALNATWIPFAKLNNTKDIWWMRNLSANAYQFWINRNDPVTLCATNAIQFSLKWNHRGKKMRIFWITFQSNKNVSEDSTDYEYFKSSIRVLKHLNIVQVCIYQRLLKQNCRAGLQTTIEQK